MKAHTEDSSGAYRFVQQRTRSPASRRTACRPDLRRYQHARPERREFVRSLVEADGDATTVTEYVEGFKSTRWITRSPFSFADFSRSAGKANCSTNCATTSDRPTHRNPFRRRSKDKEYISVKADYKVSLVKIMTSSFESEGEYVRTSGRRLDDHHPVPSQEHGDGAPVGDVHARTPPYIVNLRCIKGYVRGRVFLSDTEYVPIGENYKESFQHYIESNFKNL
ncbi:MAG: DNA-binding response regulator [Alistipes finegoldii]